MKIIISSGHGKYVRGASGCLDEVDEARKVVNKVAELLTEMGVGVEAFHDDVSRIQSDNLNTIVAFHNNRSRDLDVSVHFNAYETTGAAMGCEVLYVTQDELAKKVANEICLASGLKNRGGKKRTDLKFLNATSEPAILIETCFVDSTADAGIYNKHFATICEAIAETISGKCVEEPEPPATGESDLPMHSELLTIDPVTIYQLLKGSYVAFLSDLDICNDGSGDSHGDPHHIPQTAYYNDGKYLNADIDRYIVIPPQIRDLIPVMVMGCQARLTNLATGVWTTALCGDIGPSDKTGEAAYCAAKIVNDRVSYNSGDKTRIYLYELWPGIPAIMDDGKKYELE